MFKAKFLSALCVSASFLTLTSCTLNSSSISGRHELAKDIAASGNLTHQIITAGDFNLTSYQRINSNAENNQFIRVYIEGDGLAWLSRSTPSLDPTPTNPLALKLAATDNSANVIYLARPCQYSGTSNAQPCAQKYWMGSRYAPEVLKSYNIALNAIKEKKQTQSFELIGFSGGGAIAALLAAMRSDVKSLRSVAGNLDHKAHSAHHNVSIMNNSLNPPEYAARLQHIPQHHFIGTKDKIVPDVVYKSYAGSLKYKNCLQQSYVANATHIDGWAEGWNALLQKTPYCAKQ